MPPFESRIPLAEPMPKVVSPRVPPELVMVPVKVLAEAGFSTQTPPSFLPIWRTGVFVPVALLSTDEMILKSVLDPRNSSVIVRPAVLVEVELVKTPESPSGPEPEESIRYIRLAPKAEETNCQGRLAVSPAPT